MYNYAMNLPKKHYHSTGVKDFLTRFLRGKNMKHIKMSNREKFETFQKNNEHVLSKLIELCERAVYSGRKKLSMGQMFEVLRWDYSLKTNAKDFKLSNSYRAYYTRLIRKVRPELGNLITSKRSRADCNENANIS